MVRPDATFLKEVLLHFMIRYKTLYTSRQYAYVLCHDYKPEGRDEYVCQTDIKLKTKQYPFKSTSFQRFIHKMRQKRDATLAMPKLILPSIQINMNGGNFPEPEANGIRYLKIPFNYF